MSTLKWQLKQGSCHKLKVLFYPAVIFACNIVGGMWQARCMQSMLMNFNGCNQTSCFICLATLTANDAYRERERKAEISEPTECATLVAKMLHYLGAFVALRLSFYLFVLINTAFYNKRSVFYTDFCLVNSIIIFTLSWGFLYLVYE